MGGERRYLANVKSVTHLETVKLELSRGEKPGSVCGGGLPQNWELLLNWGLSLNWGLLLNWSLLWPGRWGSSTNVLSCSEISLSGKKSGLCVAGIEGVDEGINSGTIGTVWNKSGILGVSWGSSGGKVGTIAVEGEVAVGGVVGVDEGVEVGVLDFIIVVTDLGFRLLLLDLLDLLLDLLDLLDWGSNFFIEVVSIKSSSSLASGRNVGPIQDSESVLACRVLDSVGLAILSDVGVLSNPVTVNVCLLPENVSVFSGEGSSGAAISSIESLLLQDLGILRVDLGTAGHNGAR